MGALCNVVMVCVGCAALFGCSSMICGSGGIMVMLGVLRYVYDGVGLCADWVLVLYWTLGRNVDVVLSSWCLVCSLVCNGIVLLWDLFCGLCGSVSI